MIQFQENASTDGRTDEGRQTLFHRTFPANVAFKKNRVKKKAWKEQYKILLHTEFSCPEHELLLAKLIQGLGLAP